MASITQLGDKWRAQVYVKGTRASAVWDTRREAMAWAVRREAELLAQASAGHTFDDAATRYEREVSVRKSSPQWEARRLAVMRQAFAGLTLAELDAPDIARWRDDRLQTVTGSTVMREVNLLRHVLRVARDEWRWLNHDPFKGVKLPKENEPRTALWGWREIRRVLRAGQRAGGKTGEVVDAFHISLRTAMRLKECLAAPQHYNPKTRTVTLTDTKTGRRVIPIGRVAGKLLQRPAFVVQPNEASTLFAKLTRRLMIDGPTFHDARATALTHLARRVDVLTLAKVSGHRDIALLNAVYYRESVADVALRLR